MTWLRIVVKVGGSLLSDHNLRGIITDTKTALTENQLTIIHGGADEVTRYAERLGKKQEFVRSPEGMTSRYTDRETVEIYTMVMAGRINKQFVSQLISGGVQAAGLSGIDGGLIRAERKTRLIVLDERGRRKFVPGGYTGRITSINAGLLENLQRSGVTPVVAPVALGSEFEPLNVDSDRVAARIAGALKADEVIFLTDVPGLKVSEKVVERLSLKEAKQLLGKMGAGMDKKILAATEAVQEEVPSAVIASGSRKSPIMSAMNHQDCTVITR